MKKRKHDDASLSCSLIRRPIQRWGWLFLLPTFAAFCVGFLYPFAKGLFCLSASSRQPANGLGWA